MAKKKTDSSDKPQLVTIKIKDAIIGSSYSFYIGDVPRRYTQGVVEESTFTIKFPKNMGSSGTFNIKAPRTDRLFNPPQINIPFKVEGDTVDLNINQSTHVPLAASPVLGKKAETKKIVKNEPRKSGKKLIRNKLKEKVQKAKEETIKPIDEGVSVNNNETLESQEKPKDNFWEKFR
jgi:hypothetical protein